MKKEENNKNPKKDNTIKMLFVLITVIILFLLISIFSPLIYIGIEYWFESLKKGNLGQKISLIDKNYQIYLYYNKADDTKLYYHYKNGDEKFITSIFDEHREVQIKQINKEYLGIIKQYSKNGFADTTIIKLE